MSVAKIGLSFITVICSVTACSDSEPLGKVRGGDDAGEDASTPPALRYFVGAVDDSDIRLGVRHEANQARLFFCGGPSSYASATRWVVRELAADGGFEFDEDGWQVSGRLSEEEIAGELKLGAEASRDFSARVVGEGTIAGLYEGQGDCGRIGLIVSQEGEGEEASGQGACVSPGRLPEQVNPILPIVLEGGAIRVEVGGVESSVRAAGPPN